MCTSRNPAFRICCPVGRDVIAQVGPHLNNVSLGCPVLKTVKLPVLGKRSTINLKINGANRQFDGDPEMPLLWYLRDDLRMNGT
jgi:hypothetical protein